MSVFVGILFLLKVATSDRCTVTPFDQTLEICSNGVCVTSILNAGRPIVTNKCNEYWGTGAPTSMGFRIDCINTTLATYKEFNTTLCAGNATKTGTISLTTPCISNYPCLSTTAVISNTLSQCQSASGQYIYRGSIAWNNNCKSGINETCSADNKFNIISHNNDNSCQSNNFTLYQLPRSVQSSNDTCVIINSDNIWPLGNLINIKGKYLGNAPVQSIGGCPDAFATGIPTKTPSIAPTVGINETLVAINAQDIAKLQTRVYNLEHAFNDCGIFNCGKLVPRNRAKGKGFGRLE